MARRGAAIGLVVAALLGCEGDRSVFFASDASAVDLVEEVPGPDAGGPLVFDVPPSTDVVTDHLSLPDDRVLAADAVCSATSVEAPLVRLPVDIVWVVDNSVSMAPAVREVTAGLNRFAALIGERGLDYRVVMLSLRSPTPNVTVNGGMRYAVCIPPPLAGDARCGNGSRFRHSSVDVRSTQPLEQFLGTLAQSPGYQAGQDRGGEPWRDFLRNTATKSIVVVSDDNARMSADVFERFGGGTNPYSRSFTLPPGILHPMWNGLFNEYLFHGIYGWLSEAMPDATCAYPSGGTPPTAGTTYNELVRRTGGARARICDGAAAWAPFFERVASAVERGSRIACDLEVPAPPAGSVLDRARVNVVLRGSSRTTLGRVAGPTACGPAGGWHFDDEQAPRRVILCPASCTRAQAELQGVGRGIEVLFGCLSVPG